MSTFVSPAPLLVVVVVVGGSGGDVFHNSHHRLLLCWCRDWGTSAVSKQFTAAASRAKIQLRKYLGTGIRNKQL